MIQAKVVADSLNEFDNRLTTLLVTMPRYILAEFNTHRALSKNSASSRAIKFSTNLKSVMENPFIPVAWMKDHKGMQGNEYFEADNGFIRAWIGAMNNAAAVAKTMNDFGVTKQMCNRLLEPFMWHTVLVSATEWENFFALRCPDYMTGIDREKSFRSWKDLINFKYEYLTRDGSLVDFDNNADIIKRLKLNRGQADIHMMLTAEAIWDAINESTPKNLEAGEWHIPFGDNIDHQKLCGYILDNVPDQNIVAKYTTAHGAYIYDQTLINEYFIKVSTARCAQTSYTVIGEDEKELNYEKLIALHDRLSKSGHWSPFEHCARAMTHQEYENQYKTFRRADMTDDPLGKILVVEDKGVCGNYKGFIQYRKMFANENITK